MGRDTGRGRLAGSEPGVAWRASPTGYRATIREAGQRGGSTARIRLTASVSSAGNVPSARIQSKYEGSSITASPRGRPRCLPKSSQGSPPCDTRCRLRGASWSSSATSRGRSGVAVELPAEYVQGADQVAPRAVGALDVAPRVEADRRSQVARLVVMKDALSVDDAATFHREHEAGPAELGLQHGDVEASDVEPREVAPIEEARQPRRDVPEGRLVCDVLVGDAVHGGRRCGNRPPGIDAARMGRKGSGRLGAQRGDLHGASVVDVDPGGLEVEDCQRAHQLQAVRQRPRGRHQVIVVHGALPSGGGRNDDGHGCLSNTWSTHPTYRVGAREVGVRVGGLAAPAGIGKGPGCAARRRCATMPAAPPAACRWCVTRTGRPRAGSSNPAMSGRPLLRMVQLGSPDAIGPGLEYGAREQF